MTQRQFNYSTKLITAQVVDESNSYLWIAFAKNAEGNCILKKVSAFQPNQVFYSLELEVDEIVDMKISGSNIYLAYNDSNYIGAIYSMTSPLTTYLNLNIPSGITEAPVAVEIDNTTLYYLIPGNTSGTNAKISEFTTSGTHVENIDLTTVTSAQSFSLDSATGDLWVVTYTAPAKLVRVYKSGAVWNYTTTILE